ncbi:ATP-binding cassette domain-containing protein [Sunxiuqinia elliptica]|uniref:Polar amino acid transport system ATP-binding protein/putative ABC transport system ATP-binding protein n=1 Tax=Sunxiuqinia elliptica TaxID=655355 RepID=A0A4R6HB37_9BACT|nr:ATP-binding cassette domain-containing protein [Sunxiuqinia elliptica]TDO04941.1 polar amino acid transport system ATP-binding protein/putative ABC transport system ATP-binding protein [Sunxiuqinia elliptica]TDO64489.1 polar amino acid transport system ATP-binding protein/putative ABC transport system ATP-binding protein [Sunxiuqinia elliptica]
MIRFKNVSLNLGGKQLLKTFNLRINRGDKVLLAAQSGSGKTSLLRLLLGFIDPDEGKIFWGKKELTSETIRKIRTQIAYLSQDVDFPNGKVKDVFQEIFEFDRNRHLNYRPEMLAEKLQEFDLSEELLEKNTSLISGGERQRLGWILVQLLDRPLLLLDEPTSAMDEKQKQRFINYIAETKKTVICVSHDSDWQLPEMKVITTLLS